MGQDLVKPKKLSIILTLTVACIVFFGSQVSPMVGYFAGLTALVAMIFASFMESFWPTRSKSENSVIFALFWGTMIGGVFPFLVKKYVESGFMGVYETLLF